MGERSVAARLAAEEQASREAQWPEWSLAELRAEESELLEEMAGIKSQIEAYLANPDTRSLDWYRRARTARRFKGLEHQRLQDHIAARCAAAKAARVEEYQARIRECADRKIAAHEAWVKRRRAFAAHFIRAARTHLDVETFQRLVGLAREAQAEEPPNA